MTQGHGQVKSFVCGAEVLLGTHGQETISMVGQGWERMEKALSSILRLKRFQIANKHLKHDSKSR